MNSIRRILPSDIPAKEIIVDAYLREWSEYGSHEDLKSVFTAVDRLLGFNVMFFLKYIRTRDLHLANADKVDAISANSRALAKRYENFALYLNRFINDRFS